MHGAQIPLDVVLHGNLDHKQKGNAFGGVPTALLNPYRATGSQTQAVFHSIVKSTTLMQQFPANLS